jgi:BirA family biotin operon repressor/biotin-[acetyl-CoA-carboxylase] ligase
MKNSACFHSYAELPSTNDAAWQLLAEGCQEGTVAFAAAQTAGRGQQGAQWESEAGLNITCSVALRPAFLPVSRIFYLSKAVSLGIADYLHAQGIPALIKWPNDIYVGGCKICGFLIEQSLIGEHVEQSVVGVGFNVNQQRFLHAPNATSMLLCDGAARSVPEVLSALVASILRRYGRLKAAHGAPKLGQLLAQMDKEYAALLYRRRGVFPYRCGGEVFLAAIAGVSPEGELRLQAEGGALRSFGFKEVEFVH